MLSETYIDPLSKVHPDVKVGRYVRITEFTTVGSYPLTAKWDKQLDRRIRQECEASVELKDYVDIGPHCSIHRGTKRDTVIGEGTFLGAYTNIGHDARVGKNCLIANGTIILGWVEIGDNTFIGLGTRIRERTKIGKDCYIGMGSLVVDDIPDGTYGFGSPFEVKERKITVKKILRRLRIRAGGIFESTP